MKLLRALSITGSSCLLLAFIIWFWWRTPEAVIRQAGETAPKTYEQWYARAGQIGDMYGSVNALFSGLALAGVIVAVFLQSRELKLQREELELTRRELARSAAAQTDQVDSMYLSGKLSALPIMIEQNKERLKKSGHPKFQKVTVEMLTPSWIEAKIGTSERFISQTDSKRESLASLTEEFEKNEGQSASEIAKYHDWLNELDELDRERILHFRALPILKSLFQYVTELENVFSTIAEKRIQYATPADP